MDKTDGHAMVGRMIPTRGLCIDGLKFAASSAIEVLEDAGGDFSTMEILSTKQFCDQTKVPWTNWATLAFSDGNLLVRDQRQAKRGVIR